MYIYINTKFKKIKLKIKTRIIYAVVGNVHFSVGPLKNLKKEIASKESPAIFTSKCVCNQMFQSGDIMHSSQ